VALSTLFLTFVTFFKATVATASAFDLRYTDRLSYVGARMDDYPPISSSLTFKGESYPYSVFFGEQTPSETRADIGDLFFVSPHPNEARARIQNKEGRPRAKMEGIFMKTNDGWTEMPYGREGMNHTPLAKHPTFGASYRLDEAFCAWKSKTWYTTD